MPAWSLPAGAEQDVEVKVSAILHFGTCDTASYPLAKKKHSMEFVREKAHLRPRTNTIGAVARVRNQLAYATHNFFQGHGFLYVHTPVITASDCEGAGEMFQVCCRLRPRPQCTITKHCCTGAAGLGQTVRAALACQTTGHAGMPAWCGMCVCCACYGIAHPEDSEHGVCVLHPITVLSNP